MAMSSTSALDQRFALDVQGVDALRRTVRTSPEEGMRQVARQFEAVFLQMVLKSMREATPSEGLFGGQQEKLYTSMLDQQLSQGLSGRGVGLADAMYAQLARASMPAAAVAPDMTPPAAAPAVPAAPAAIPTGPQATAPATRASAAPAHVEDFIARMQPAAEAASRETGVPARLILAQAALESGWGKREIRGEDGTPSFNVFGIKADRRWTGRVAETATTEYVDGVAQPTRAAFRAYGSYEEAFADYAKFLARQPRYAAVLSAGDPARAAEALQRAGYATDPGYAAKLVRVMNRFA
jgi:flagellar protein FlgJ